MSRDGREGTANLARASLLLAGLVSAPGHTAAPPPEFTESIEVREATVEVFVTDRTGEPVAGLRPDDFRIEEDGRPVPVTGLAWIGGRDAALRGSGRQASPHLLILLVQDPRPGDTWGLLPRLREACRDTATWLRAGLGAADRVAVLVHRASLRLLVEPTADVEVAARALEGIWWSPDLPPDPDGSGLFARALAEDPEAARGEIHASLRRLARALGRLTGRKALVLLGSGWGRVGSFGGYEPDRTRLPPTVEALNEADVAVFAVDLGPPEGDHLMSQGLRQLAAETGGRYFGSSLSAEIPLRAIARETGARYVVSYRPATPSGSGTRRLEVRVARPGLELSYRRRVPAVAD